MPSLTLTPSRGGLTRRLLRSPIVDLLLGPHGVDRYLELISPALTVGDARAEVLAVRRQTPRSATLTLRPNAAWEGFSREGARERLDADTLDADTLGDVDDACWVAACGPPALVDAARAAWAERGGRPTQLLAETFRPLARAASNSSGEVASGRLRLERSDRSLPLAAGTLLEQAEAAGLSPEFGCRMGICHTCTCRKAAGSVRNLLTGEVSDEEDEDIQLCVSVPAGDVALEL